MQLNDPLCIINWMHQLEHSSVKSISHIEPVVTEEDIENGVTPDKRHENGGVRVEFANSSLIPQVRHFSLLASMYIAAVSSSLTGIVLLCLPSAAMPMFYSACPRCQSLCLLFIYCFRATGSRAMGTLRAMRHT